MVTRERIQMPQTAELKSAVAETEAWIDEFMATLGWHTRELVFQAFTGALHAFRDSLPWDEAANVGAYFPPLLRGIYFDGWHPASPSLPLASRTVFLERIRDAVHHEPACDAEQVARALFSLLSRRLPKSELEDVKAVAPEELHALWPV
jgi:uncharacterized protein (DUF2267 family)